MKIIFTALIISVFVFHAVAQSWSLFGGNSIGSTEFLGGDNTSTIPLRIKTMANYGIDFYTANTQRATIAASGYVGIGTATPAAILHVYTAPSLVTSSYTGSLIQNLATSTTASINKVGLEIQSTGTWSGTAAMNAGLVVHVSGGTTKYSGFFSGGDINENDLDFGYMINGGHVLWCANNVNNIFVGIGAGIANTTGDHNTFTGYYAGGATSTGNDNTCVGFNSGSSNTSGDKNTFIGSEAGWNNVLATDNTMIGAFAGYNNNVSSNTFIGSGAGYSNISGDGNTFIGKYSGETNINGICNTFLGNLTGYYSTASNNTFLGFNAGYANTSGASNTFVGEQAGFFNTSGGYNVFLGYLAGNDFNGHANTTGNNNIFIGANARPNTGTLTNAIAIGSGTVVTHSNQLILGDNNVNVGIGLSGNTTGPQKKLEINDGAIGNSGLRFTQLTTSTAPITNPGSGLLSVNSSGDVIYVTDNSAGNVSVCIPASPNYLTKWCASGNSIEKSMMYELNAQRIGISTTNPQAKLDVDNTTDFIGINSFSSLNPSFINIGVNGSAQNAGLLNIGLLGHAPNQITFPGIPTPGSMVLAIPFNSGIFGQAQNAPFNFGGVFQADQTICPGENIGIYASAIKTCNNPGIAGYFRGNLLYTGSLQHVSDAKFKDSIQSLKYALSAIKEIQAKTFVFKSDSFPYMNFPEGINLGFIAQQIDTVLPELVLNATAPQLIDTNGIILQDTISYKTIDYSELIPLAIAGIQEQQTLMDSLAQVKVSACPLAGPTPPNRLTKWDSVNKEICSSMIYDDGRRVGIPTPSNSSYFSLTSSEDTVAAIFSSTNTEATEVIKAVYATNNNADTVVAVSGYSKYSASDSSDNGIGGQFVGGLYGVDALAEGNNDVEIGLLGEAKGSNELNTGVLGYTYSSSDGVNSALYGYATNSNDENRGITTQAVYSSSVAINTGAKASASGSSYENFGGKFQASDTPGVNYGVYASVNNAARNSYAGYFDGNVHATGNITWSSDSMLKKNIHSYSGDSALTIISKLLPKTYSFKTNAYPSLSLPKGRQYGLIAQEVEKILPDIVSEITQPETRDEHGHRISPPFDYKGLNYVSLIPILISAVKAQQTEIDELKNRISQMNK